MGLFSSSVCLCGTWAGYPHPPECPYPMYSLGSDEQCGAWFEAQIARLLAPSGRRALNDDPMTPGEIEADRRANADVVAPFADINDLMLPPDPRKGVRS